jgi:hypothetical protein
MQQKKTMANPEMNLFSQYELGPNFKRLWIQKTVAAKAHRSFSCTRPSARKENLSRFIHAKKSTLIGAFIPSFGKRRLTLSIRSIKDELHEIGWNATVRQGEIFRENGSRDEKRNGSDYRRRR